MGVKLAAASGGSIELVPTNTASNFTVTVPAVTASVLTDSAGILNIGSGQIYKDASGNVGIGTSSPAEKLTVNGNAFLKGNRSLIFQQDSGVAVGTVSFRNSAGVQKAAVAAYYNVADEGALEFLGPTGSTNMMLTSSGNLLVGQTSNGGSGKIAATVANGANGFVITNTSGTASYNAAAFYNNGASFTNTGAIAVSGSTTSYNTSSDYRLKEDIVPMSGALAKIAALKPCTYKWKVDGSDGQGFIAHELDEVVPECVGGKKDAMRTEQYEVTPAVKDEEGNTVTEAVMGEREVPSYQGIDTSFLVATLTAAIQEQQALIVQLQADVAALKGEQP